MVPQFGSSDVMDEWAEEVVDAVGRAVGNLGIFPDLAQSTGGPRVSRLQMHIFRLLGRESECFTASDVLFSTAAAWA